MKLALVGGDVSHSLSGKMHAFLLGKFGETCEYELCSVSAADFPAAAERLLASTVGFNVTVPYKLSVLPHLADLRGDAAAFGAVNTVLSAERAGYNTDGEGFCMMLAGAGIAAEGKRALVLGAGGAARSVVHSLVRSGADVSVYNRTAERAEEIAREAGAKRVLAAEGDWDVLVNATSCGMGAQEGLLPCPEETCRRAGALVDLIYRPRETAFLRAGRQAGRPTVNGHAMLFYQAYLADCIYLGREPDRARAAEFYEEYSEREGE